MPSTVDHEGLTFKYALHKQNFMKILGLLSQSPRLCKVESFNGDSLGQLAASWGDLNFIKALFAIDHEIFVRRGSSKRNAYDYPLFIAGCMNKFDAFREILKCSGIDINKHLCAAHFTDASFVRIVRNPTFVNVLIRTGANVQYMFNLLLLGIQSQKYSKISEFSESLALLAKFGGCFALFARGQGFDALELESFREIIGQCMPLCATDDLADTSNHQVRKVRYRAFDALTKEEQRFFWFGNIPSRHSDDAFPLRIKTVA